MPAYESGSDPVAAYAEKTSLIRSVDDRKWRTKLHWVDHPAGSKRASFLRRNHDTGSDVSPEIRPVHGFGTDR